MINKLSIYNLQFTNKRKERKVQKASTLIRTIRKNLISEKGFTLIELLIVISIIGILAALATASYTSAQKQARDTTRKSDLAQYRTALEAFANKNDGLYPTSSTTTPSRIDPVNLCTTLGLTNCPRDPKILNDYYYSYISEVGSPLYSAKSTQYVLWAKFENVSPTTYWVACSNGGSGKVTTIPTTPVCPTFVVPTPSPPPI